MKGEMVPIKGAAMRKLLGWLFAIGIMAALLPLFSGCARKPAQGKLQIMFSGNFRGNAEPCG
jgi:hypothetical protein